MPATAPRDIQTNIGHRGSSSGTLNGMQEWQVCISIVIIPPVLLLLQERVRSKNVKEACVINEECSFRNPNVLCINSFCNCSHPYVLTAAKLCLLRCLCSALISAPLVAASSHRGDMFTIALIVALAFVPLLLAGRYAYQKMLRRRDSSGRSSSSSFRRKRKRNRDASTSSSMTCILPEDMSLSEVDIDGVYLMRDNDGGEAQESRPQPRGPRRGSCMRDSSMPPRHPSGFFNQRDTKCPKVCFMPMRTHGIDKGLGGWSECLNAPVGVWAPQCHAGSRSKIRPAVGDVDSSSYESDDEVELPSSGTLVAKAEDDPCATPPRRKFKEERLRSHARRKTGQRLRVMRRAPDFDLAVRFLGAELVYNEQDECRSTPMHTLGFKNEQMRNIIDKHRIVVTVEVHEPRHTNVSLTKVSQKEITKKQEPLKTGEFVGKATGPLKSKLLEEYGGMPDLRSALEKSSSARQSSGPSAINDKNLDKAAIKSSSKETSGTDSGTAVVSADVSDTSSGVASTCATQAGKIPVSSTKVKTRSNDGDDTSRETARALLITSDLDEGSIPLSGSMSVSFVSSTSSSNVTYRVSDLADIPRLQNNVSEANNETGDGSIVVRLPLPRLASSAVQTESPHQPASSVTEFGEFLREVCESTQEFLPCRNTASSRRDVGTLVSDGSFEQPLKLSDLILLQHPEVGLTGFVAVDFTEAADANGGAEREGISLEAKTEREPELRLNTHGKVSAVGPISEVTCISNSSPKAAYSQRRLELEGSGRNEATTETVVERATEPDVHVAAPQLSQHVTFLPNCAVAILLPGGTIRTVDPEQQALSYASPQGTAAIRLEQRSPQARTAAVLGQATFESLYNAILQPPPDVTAAEEPSAPKDVNPVRATLSARALSSDEPLTTVMPIESPSGSPIKPDGAEATGISGSGAPSHFRQSRPRGSHSRSLSSSRMLAVTKAPGDAATEVASAAATVPERSGASANCVIGTAGASPEGPGGANGGQESRAQLLPPFKTFEEMYSDVCSRPSVKIPHWPVCSKKEERRGSDEDQTE
ncbi:hypothetical protein HPB50_014038 [Hyalomma asiaticum]|uniref:Uncharacterized protein n=1 Tax=Hyalomma asiaticum TaxID=266040 RepID=A0ACB7THP4_HYAAI|nr:hypothetical protein HPB50_014038 [Hyalomma asiaticum]